MIRPETLRPAASWQPPTKEEILHVMSITGKSGSELARFLGVSGRKIRDWAAKESIPYAAWALLVDLAGLGQIWK